MKSFFVALLLFGAVNSNAANADKKSTCQRHQRMSLEARGASIEVGGLSILHMKNQANKVPALAEERGACASFLPKQNHKFSTGRTMGRARRDSAVSTSKASIYGDDDSDADGQPSDGFIFKEGTGGKGKSKKAGDRYAQLESDKEAGLNGCGVEIDL